MMEVSSGKIKIKRGSQEEKEFNTLYFSIKGLSDQFLVDYHNSLIRIGSMRTTTQDMMIHVIAYARRKVNIEYI